MKRFKIMLLFFILFSLLFSSGKTGRVEARDFKVYGYSTPDQGEMEVSYWVDYFIKGNDLPYPFFGKSVDKDKLWRHTVEVEYGVTDRWTLAYYADFEQPKDEDFKYVQSRAVFLRYRLFEPGQRFFDTTVYFEYYLPNHNYSENEKLETKIILEKNAGPLQIKLNPIFDKHLSGDDVGEGLEFEYAAGVYLKGLGAITPGLEFYGKMGEIGNLKSPNEQQHFIFPVIKAVISKHVDIDLGLGFGLTGQSDDLVVKGIFSYAYN